ncbi:hypothetical protein BC938DRAFT_477892 [Jimgerdemannia flammicorona]|uniref:Uncharacterized protein n=1 Tax=Jimgerdemannia flammicorona TaxID=994334 RepID=A0A433QNR1_9FUNG|nr:hypothetical protein BC938DRAFT_477892 [Jimgerdemannia flammicorona]
MEYNGVQIRKRKNEADEEMQPHQQPKRLNTNDHFPLPQPLQLHHHTPVPTPTPTPTYARYTPGPYGGVVRVTPATPTPTPLAEDVDMADSSDGSWESPSAPPSTPCSRSPPLGMTLAHYDPALGGYHTTMLTTVEPTMKFERGQVYANRVVGLEKWGACVI